MGLYFYNARYYDPALGRFVQADSIVPNPGDPQSLNRYSYTLNNPLKYTDPSGHFFLLALGLGLAGGAIGGAVYGYGSQVVDNLQQGMNLGQALTTDIDSGEVLKYTGFGTAIGGVGGLVVGGLGELGIATGLIKTGAAAGTAAQTIQNTACGGDCSDEGKTLLDNALVLGKNGVSAVGRALQKHSARSGSWLEGLGEGGNAAKNTEIGKSLLEKIIQDGTTTYATHPTFGDVTKIRLADGSGAWWKATGEFIGFLERYTPKK